MSIPGIPGASEPAFRTRDARWMGLDALVHETRASLVAEGTNVSLIAVKSAIQLARQVVQEPTDRSTEELVATVTESQLALIAAGAGLVEVPRRLRRRGAHTGRDADD